MSGVLSSYVFGLLAIVALAVAWVAVQFAWRRAFPSAILDPDVLAGRPGCGTCGCVAGEPCRKEETNETAGAPAAVIQGDARAGLSSQRGSARRGCHE
jgi:hypothetical protein